ncbi:GGDEF domain-containing phosphodiesterase [Butyrivibrio fibrisolvens]|uniref:Diguanylate cyclase (GGDEF) domain-containing protein n=1 Tax=Butyrivibrio fibrisolvens TaxID=831 RepID=A0A317G3P3_BUTFI|nr:GGDEF domain-containing phosphodiesterase [Butyrivibrio fibrisolvens]PWT27030.1 hypothetical protein CPT75_07890 [Butyrivibrio fibrisolvens]
MPDIKCVTDRNNFDYDLYTKMYKSSETDPLTGLLSISSFRKISKIILGEVREHDSRTIVFIYIDIRDFKGINEEFGFEQGDEVLKSFGTIIKEVFYGRTCGYFFADHFVVMCFEDEALRGIEEVQRVLHEMYTFREIMFDAGIYRLEDVHESVMNACDRAKDAMDAIKGVYSQNVRFYDDELGFKIRRKRYIINELDNAIANGNIQAWIQPIMRTLSGRLAGVEVLARWNDPIYGFMNPAEFIGILEECKQIYKLDIAIVRAACRNFNRWYSQYGTAVPFSVNLSRIDFEMCDIFSEIKKAASEYDVDPKYIRIEITESVLMREPEFMKEVIAKFHEAGYEVWMDDFGSGFSSLNVMKEFDFDLIKIDMTFLRTFDDKSHIIIPAIINISKKLGKKTLAEGVETNEHVDALREWGCDMMQGYLYHKPVPPDDEYIHIFGQNPETAETDHDRKLYGEASYANVLDSSIFSKIVRPDGTKMRTSRAVAIVELKDDMFKLMYTNEAFRYTISQVDIDSVELAQKYLNDNRRQYYHKMRELFHSLSSDNEYVAQDFILSGELFVIRAKFIARDTEEDNDRIMGIITLENISRSPYLKEQKMVDYALRDIVKIFERIDLWHIDENYAEVVYNSANFFVEAGKPALDYGMEMFIQKEVYPKDSARYRQFMNYKTILDRIHSSGMGFVSENFRFRDKNDRDKFIWKTFIMVDASTTDERRVYACIRPSDSPARMNGYQSFLENKGDTLS